MKDRQRRCAIMLTTTVVPAMSADGQPIHGRTGLLYSSIAGPKTAEDRVSSRTGRALALLGDHWTLHILQRVFLGQHRYQEIRDSIHASDSILTNRLKTLTEGGLLVKTPYRDGRIRYEYQLTPAGKATWRIYVAAWMWECDWLDRRVGRHPELIHQRCGHEARPVLVCGKCHVPVTPRDTTITRSAPRLTYVGTVPRRHRQARTLALNEDDNLSLRQETMEILGDRWNTALAAAAVIGIRVYYHTYHSVNGDRFITYVWCPVCHTFSGSSGPPRGRKVLDDLLASMDPQERLAPEANMEKMLKTLDRLWEQGKLPRSGRPSVLRPGRSARLRSRAGEPIGA